MKRLFSLMCLILLAAGFAGCQKKEPEPPVLPEPPATEGPLQMETLRVEIPRGTLDTGALSSVVKELPVMLQEYFVKTGEVEIQKVEVTVGSSSAASAQALAAGNVDLAFLPAEAFLLYGGEATVLFADAYEMDSGGFRPGTRTLICAAPTEYGGQLTDQAVSGKPLSWNELNHARWGVLESSSLGGYQCFDLWLADNYGGNRVADLANVGVYDSCEALFRAAAAGEIDAFPIRDDDRAEVAEAWTLAADRTAESGMHGFERMESVWEEVSVLDVSEYLYGTVVAVTPKLAESAFSTALENVLSNMGEEQPEQMLMLGASRFAAVTDVQLDPMRRLVAMEE